MALRVVSAEFTDRNGKVTVEGDTQEEVMSADARRMAITEASSKLHRPGTSGNEVSYPVDADGQTNDDVVLGRVPTAAYRCDYNVTGGL